MEWQKGTRVVVKTSDGQVRERRVWEDVGRGVLVCTDAAFAKAELQGGEPVIVGFPREDVEPADHGPAWSTDPSCFVNAPVRTDMNRAPRQGEGWERVQGQGVVLDA